MGTGAPHTWTAVVLHALTDEQAAMIHRTDDQAQAFTLACLADLSGVSVVCRDCRVSYADVHHRPDQPWPCQGQRPKALGGPLDTERREPSRQARRLARRRALESKPTDERRVMVEMAGRRAAETARFVKRGKDDE